MVWTCPNCGFENIPDDVSTCPRCGYTKMKNLQASQPAIQDTQTEGGQKVESVEITAKSETASVAETKTLEEAKAAEGTEVRSEEEIEVEKKLETTEAEAKPEKPEAVSEASKLVSREVSSIEPGVRPKIVVVQSIAEDLKNKEFELLLDVFNVVSIGRDPENVIVIPDPYVSRRHARIYFENGKLYIEDLGSTNGTYIYDKNEGRFVKLEPFVRYPIDRGDVLKLGYTIVRIVW